MDTSWYIAGITSGALLLSVAKYFYQKLKDARLEGKWTGVTDQNICSINEAIDKLRSDVRQQYDKTQKEASEIFKEILRILREGCPLGTELRGRVKHLEIRIDSMRNGNSK